MSFMSAGFQFSTTKALTWDDFETEPFCTVEYDDRKPTANPDVEVELTERTAFYVPDNYQVASFPLSGAATLNVPADPTDLVPRGGVVTVPAGYEVALGNGDYKDTVKEQPGSSTVVQGVASDRNGIGYSGVGYKTADVRTVPIAATDGSECYDATAENAYAVEPGQELFPDAFL